MKLYRISVYTEWWVKHKPKPFYVISSTKQEAINYLQKHLKDGISVGKCIEMGEQLSGTMFVGRAKR